MRSPCWGSVDAADTFQEFEPARPALERGARRLRGPGRGRHHQGGVVQADQGGQGAGRRLRQAHPDAGPDRLPRPRLPGRGQHPQPRARAPDPADGAVGRPDEGHARPRLHHGARHRRRRLGHQDRRRDRPDPRPAPLHLRPRHRPDRRPQRFAPPHRHLRRALRLLQRHGLLHGDRRRRRRGAQAGARADAPGRGPGEDHVLGRRRLALRSAGFAAVLRGRDRRGDRRGQGLRPLRAGPRLHARSHHAGRQQRRAHHRARQPDQRQGGQAA